MPSTREALAPELEDLRAQIDRIAADAHSLTANITERQFNWQPESGRWSMAQCLGHLTVAGSILLPRIEASIRDARERGLIGQGPYRRGFLGDYFVRFTEPPPRIKFKAPRAMAPPPAEEPANSIRSFLALQDRIRDSMRQANGLDLGRAKVQSPIGSWMRFTLQQSLELIAGHQRRHLWQAWQVRNDPKFPAS